MSKRTDNAVANLGFDSIAKFGDVKVYRNKYSLPFGFIYNKGISEIDFKKMSPTQKDFCLLRACVIGDEDKSTFSAMKSFSLNDTNAVFSYDNYSAYVNELKKEEFKITKFSENNIVGT